MTVTMVMTRMMRMLTMTYSAHLRHEFVHVLIRHCLTASYVEVVLAQPLTILWNVLGKQQLRRWRVLYTQTQTFKQTGRHIQTHTVRQTGRYTLSLIKI